MRAGEKRGREAVIRGKKTSRIRGLIDHQGGAASLERGTRGRGRGGAFIPSLKGKKRYTWGQTRGDRGDYSGRKESRGKHRCVPDRLGG